MNASTYIQNVGKVTPTFGSNTINIAKKFFDPSTEKERENERIQHARMISSFLYKC